MPSMPRSTLAQFLLISSCRALRPALPISPTRPSTTPTTDAPAVVSAHVLHLKPLETAAKHQLEHTAGHHEHEHGGKGTLLTFIGGLATFYVSTLCLTVLLASLVGALVPLPILCFVQPVLEMIAAAVLADATSGAAHFLLDHMDTGDALRHCSPSSLAGVHEALDSEAFASSSGWQQFVWEQHQHHPFPFPRVSAEHQPTSLSVRRPAETGGQLVFDVAAVATSVATVGAFALGAAPAAPGWLLRVMLASYGLTWGAVRWTHFWSHERNWTPEIVHPVILWAQDVGLLLHPRVHRLHHETYDGHFCLLNGWAGEYTQCWYRAFRAVGII